MYSLIENFCLGTRRLEIFGRASSLRRGWVTLGSIDNTQAELARVDGVAWDREWWEGEIRVHTSAMGGGRPIVPTSAEIDGFRPKSPVRNNDRTNGGNTNSGGANANAMGGMGAMAMQGAPMRLIPSPGNMQMGMQVPPHGMMGGMGGVGMMNPAFAGAPMPQAAFGFDGLQQMQMGGMGMNPMAGGLGVPMNAMGAAGMVMPNPIQANPPIRLGGGPMQGMGMGVNMNMGGSSGMPAALPNPGGMGMGGMGMNVGMGMGGPPGMMQPAMGMGMGMGMAPNLAMGMNMGRNMPMMGMQQGMQQGMGVGMGMPMNANMNMGMMGGGSGAGMMGQGMQMQGMGGGPMRFNPQQQYQQQQGRPTGNQGF
jgi:mRNA m6A methyltransferase non-catalytic subunit